MEQEIRKTVVIDENTPGLEWYELEGTEFCDIPLSLLPEDANIVFDIFTPCVIGGALTTSGTINSRSALIVHDSISAGGILYSEEFIHSSYGTIQALRICCNQLLRANGDITSKEDITVHGNIESNHGSIVAGTGIFADGHIYAAQTIEFATRIYAGMDPEKNSEECDSIIKCAQVKGSGELGHGILILGYGR